jgi:hypothetical protein
MSLDDIIEIDAAGLQLAAHRIINAARGSVFDLMAKLDEELQVGDHAFREWAFDVLQAVAQFPISISAAVRLRDLFGAPYTPQMSVVDTERRK